MSIDSYRGVCYYIYTQTVCPSAQQHTARCYALILMLSAVRTWTLSSHYSSAFTFLKKNNNSSVHRDVQLCTVTTLAKLEWRANIFCRVGRWFTWPESWQTPSAQVSADLLYLFKSFFQVNLKLENVGNEKTKTTVQDSVVKLPQRGCRPWVWTEAPHLANEVQNCLHTTPPPTASLWNTLLMKVMRQRGQKTLPATDNLRLNSQPYETRA